MIRIHSITRSTVLLLNDTATTLDRPELEYFLQNFIAFLELVHFIGTA